MGVSSPDLIGERLGLELAGVGEPTVTSPAESERGSAVPPLEEQGVPGEGEGMCSGVRGLGSSLL